MTSMPSAPPAPDLNALSALSALSTRAVHAGRAGLTEAGVHVPAIDLSTTNPLAGIGSGGASYELLATGGRPTAETSSVYARLWNPTVAGFEDALAQLEGAEQSVAFASGMAALTAVLLALGEEGRRHVVAVRPLYGGSDHLLATGLLGTEVTYTTADGVAAALGPTPGSVLLETPANPTLDLVDVRAVVAAAGGVPVMVDNTFATPVLQRPAALGATLVLHSATKFIGGHGDVIGGVVATAGGPARSGRSGCGGSVPSPEPGPPPGRLPAAPRAADPAGARADAVRGTTKSLSVWPSTLRSSGSTTPDSATATPRSGRTQMSCRGAALRSRCAGATSRPSASRRPSGSSPTPCPWAGSTR